MIQAAYPQRGERPYNISTNVHRVEVAVVGEQALDNLRANAESERYDEEREVERSTTSSVQDPVECYLRTAVRQENSSRPEATHGKEEKCEEMKECIVDLRDLKGCEADVSG